MTAVMSDSEDEIVTGTTLNDSLYKPGSSHNNSFFTSSQSSSQNNPAAPDCSPSAISDMKFVVFRQSLVQLFKFCPQCGSPAEVDQEFVTGSMLTVKYSCLSGHSDLWRSQPFVDRKPVGNVLLSAAILFTGNSYTKVSSFAKTVNLAFPSRTTYQQEQNSTLFPVVQEKWLEEKSKAQAEVKVLPKVVLAGDARCDSPGHCAKYGSYTLMEAGPTQTNKIVELELVQVSEVSILSITVGFHILYSTQYTYIVTEVQFSLTYFK